MSIIACSASSVSADGSTTRISRPSAFSTRTPSTESLRYGAVSGPS